MYTIFMMVVSLIVMIAFPAWADPNDTRNSLSIILATDAPYYAPRLAEAPTGTMVSWSNDTASIHSVRHDGCESGLETCAFDSGILQPGDVFSLPATPEGVYPYHCQLHPIMRGILVVVQETPPPNTSLMCRHVDCFQR